VTEPRPRRKRPRAAPPPIRVEIVEDPTARPSRLVQALAELVVRRAKAAIAERLAAEAGQGSGSDEKPAGRQR
jgi:hypothetical protein